ncbi:MAG: YhbY family RNA-binding protein [Clostridia bacterium]|jgi:RNA-binding protein|nr:YhbY family RNA-binding protein [Clostridia bacterium]
MLTSKQRAFLRSMANSIPSIFHIGKSGVTPELTESFGQALEARELVKANVLDNNLLDARSVAQTIADRTHADIVQVIGSRFVLYRKAKNPVIELPKL